MLPNSRIALALFVLLILALVIPACKSDDEVVSPSGGSAQLTVLVQADFGTGKMTDHLKRLLKDACPDPAPDTDQPHFPAGVDCDGDGGVVTFSTPEGFTVAIKKLNIFNSEGGILEVIPDRGTLAASEVADLTQTVTLFTDDIPEADYTSLEVEFYYYELRMLINDPATEENIRIYLSDDDFAAEGNGGHHQGDITLIAADGHEYGWAAGCAPWNGTGAMADRGALMGAGGVDPETGHSRGLYGDAQLWNQDSFMQGSSQDIYVLQKALNFSISGEDRTITITFDVQNTWFFEDFDDNGLFNPGEGAEACSGNSEWSPLLPDMDIVTR